MTLQEKLAKLEQMQQDLFEIQGMDRDTFIWRPAYDARGAISRVKHEILIELGIRKR